MQRTLQAAYDDPANGKNGWNVRVVRVNLNSAEPSAYEGTATVTVGDGPEQAVNLHIIPVNDGLLKWTIDEIPPLPSP